MKKSLLCTLFLSCLFATAASAIELQPDFDLNELTPADDMTSIHNPHDPRPYPHREYFRCMAVNRRGVYFEAFGRDRRNTQQMALENCYRRGSRHCSPAGCRRMD